AYFGEGSGEILMDSIDCDGSEESLTECSHNGWGQHDCSHSEDAGVECFLCLLYFPLKKAESTEITVSAESFEIPERPVRLVDGNSENQGRIEMFHSGEWGTVCDDGFGLQAALVVCRSMGYNHGYHYGDARFGEGSGNIWLDGVDCDGDEDSIEQCDHNEWVHHDCNHSKDAGVACCE
ncbi:hypothetical protein CAPTEDRAFT_135691, partial [Capitella teleta]